MKEAARHTVSIAENPAQAAYKWVWEVFAHYAQVEFSYVAGEEKASVFVGASAGQLRYNALFWQRINNGEFAHRAVLDENGYVTFEDGTPDHGMTAFYFINCLFERAPEVHRDELNRTEYTHSIWTERKLPVTKPFVNACFDRLAAELGITPRKRPSRVWFSHDIDAVYGAWMQDGKWLVKQRRFGTFIVQAMEHFFRRPQWMNLSKIAVMERAKGVRSTFFMLTEKGRIDQRRVNSDYRLSDRKVQAELRELRRNGNEIGLHKSLNASTYDEEAKKLGDVWANRNHYLVLNWPEDLKEQVAAGIKADATLGYAEHYGFRNGYGLPFYPFDPETQTVLPILEIPLHAMDGTFSAYLKKTPEETIAALRAFIAENSENAVISVLWHNSHFTDHKFKGFPKVYEELLDLVATSAVGPVDLTALTQEFPFAIHTKTIA